MRLAGDNRLAIEQARAMMERQVHHLVRLVDDLLDLSRITRGNVQLKKARVAFSSIVAIALETSRPLIEAARQELQVSLPADTLELEADSTRLAQVFSNLLNNAAKYSDPGGRIWFTAEREGDQVAVGVPRHRHRHPRRDAAAHFRHVYAGGPLRREGTRRTRNRSDFGPHPDGDARGQRRGEERRSRVTAVNLWCDFRSLRNTPPGLLTARDTIVWHRHQPCDVCSL